MTDKAFHRYFRSRYRLEQLQILGGPAFVILKEQEILRKAAGLLGERLAEAKDAYPGYRAMMKGQPDDQEPVHYPQ